MTYQDRMAEICHQLNALRQTIGCEYRQNAGAERAIEFVTEAKQLIEHSFDLLRREDRWLRRQTPQRPSRISLH